MNGFNARSGNVRYHNVLARRARMYLPSRDQSRELNESLPASAISSSEPEPSAFFKYKRKLRLRFELITICLLSGLHTGVESNAGSKVSRVVALRAGSRTQTSTFRPS